MLTTEFKDFSGGLTERSASGETNRYSIADNFFIDLDKKLLSRNGFTWYTGRVPLNNRVATLVNFDTDTLLLACQGARVYYVNVGSWTHLTGPTSNTAFNTNTSTSIIGATEWNHHSYLGSDSGDPVLKIFKDNGGTLRLRTAGLPAYTFTSSTSAVQTALYDMLGAIQTFFLNHLSNKTASPTLPDTTYLHKSGSNLPGYTDASTLSISNNLSSCISALNTLRSVYDDHIQDILIANSTAPTYHLSTDSYSVAVSEAPVLNYRCIDPDLTLDSGLTLQQVLPYANDLRNKVQLHSFALNTHFSAWKNPSYPDATSAVTGFGQYTTSWESYPEIRNTTGKIYYSDEAILDLTGAGSIKNYLDDLKTEITDHLGGGNVSTRAMHYLGDTVHTLPSAVTTLLSDEPDSYVTQMIYAAHLANIVWRHAADSTYRWEGATSTKYGLIKDPVTYPRHNSTIFTANRAIGSAEISTVSPNTSAITTDASAFNTQPYVMLRPFRKNGGVWLVGTDFESNAFPNSSHPGGAVSTSVFVTALPAANEVDLNRSPSATVAGDGYVFTHSYFHYNSENVSNFLSPGRMNTYLELIDPNFTTAADITALSSFCTAINTALRTHALSGYAAYDNDTLPTYEDIFTQYGFTRTPYSVTYPFAAPSNFPVHFGWTKDLFPVQQNAYSFSSTSSPRITFYPWSRTLEEDQLDSCPTGVSYLYKFHYKYSYSTQFASFEDLGPVSDSIQVLSTASVAEEDDDDARRFPIEFANIPVLANASNENWDTSTITKEIYRTVNGGTVYYKVGSLANATTTFNDDVMDSALVNNAQLYTNGGAVSNDKPPATAKLVTLDRRTYYASGSKVFQSKDSDPDSVPATFFDQYEEEVTALGATRANVIVFTATKAHRLSGEFSDNGQGSMSHEIIPGSVGCNCVQSVVNTPEGVFWVNLDGIYFTDGATAARVTDLPDTFKTFTSTATMRKAIKGQYSQTMKKIFWTIQAASGDSAPSLIYALDLQFGIKKDLMPLTRIVGASNFNPTTLALFGDALYYGDNDGYVFYLDSTSILDYEKDTGVSPSSWERRSIFWDYKSADNDYGTASERKYFTRLFIQCEQMDTNLSLQPISDADKGRVTSNLPIIRSRKLTDWGDSKIDFITASEAGEIIDCQRRFAGDGGLRSNYRSIRMKNAYCVIVSGDQMGLVNVANVSGSTYSVTLVNSATRKWPLYSVGYYIRLNGVDYLVTTRTSDSVIRVTSGTNIAGNNQEFEMWGYPKNERMRLLSYSVAYDGQGTQQKSFGGDVGEGGENA